MAPGFKVIFAHRAENAAAQLSPEERARLHMMLVEIAEVAQVFDGRDADPSNLSFSVGRVNVRYSIEPDKRTVTVQHVLTPSTKS